MKRQAWTEAQLTDPAILMRPMTWDEWFLRTMILEKQRRDKVLAGRVDPTPFEPWRICSPEDMKDWHKSIAQKRK